MTQELFDRIRTWQKKTFGKATAISKLHHLREELGELHMELVNPNQCPEDVEPEYADCFLLLIGSAAEYGMNLDDINRIISEKMDVNESRTWGEPDENGVVRHIKEVDKREIFNQSIKRDNDYDSKKA